MKIKLILVYLLVSLCVTGFGQDKKNLMIQINSALDNKAESFMLLEKTGYIEQRQGNFLYRIKLEDIGSIVEKTNADNSIVNINCRDISCISIVKSDTNSITNNGNAYFFSKLESATQFASGLHALAMMYQSPGNKIELNLVSGQEVKINHIAASTKPEEKEKDLLDEYLKETTSDKKVNPKKEIDSDSEMDEEETKETKTAKPAPAKKNKDLDTDTNDEISDTPKHRRGIDKPEPKEKEEDDPAKGEKRNDWCTQIDQFLNHAKTKFVSIEGAELNTKTKINESKLKWKGAKRSYLSWHKKQRAFIAEIKTSKDFELLQIEYDELQTKIDNCLGGDWEFTDKSNDDEYADFNGEIRDTAYHSENNSATLRIILISDEDKYTLFVRIQ